MKIPQSAIRPFEPLGFPTPIVSPGFNHLLQHAFDQINEGGHIGFPADTPRSAANFAVTIIQYLKYMGATNAKVVPYPILGGMQYFISYTAPDGVTHIFNECIWLHPMRKR